MKDDLVFDDVGVTNDGGVSTTNGGVAVLDAVLDVVICIT